MDALKIFYDRQAKTLTVWFDDPVKEHSAEETGEEVILIKDREGRVIGFERLNFAPFSSGPIKVDVAEESAS